MSKRFFTKRSTFMLSAAAMAAVLGACQSRSLPSGTDITGTLPPLQFNMVRADDGRQITATDYRGHVVLLYFGYTFCPDICPLTLANAVRAVSALGPLASRVKVVFVTVDPQRDTLPVLKIYSAAFGPQVDALRGDDDELAALARRYRVAYAVDAGDHGRPYTVMHGSAIYAFDGDGNARILLSSISTNAPDIGGVTADLRLLLGRSVS